MNRFKIYFLILTATYTSATLNCTGQDSLSLSDAIKIALNKNFDIQIAKKNLEIDHIKNSWGEAGRYPTIDINLTQGNNISDQSQNPTSFIQGLLKSNSIQGAATLNWILFNGFKVKANKEKLEQLELQSEGNAKLVVENAIQGVILAYYGARLEQEKIALLQNVLDLSREKYHFNLLKKAMGVTATVDILQFQTAYLMDSSNILMQKLAYHNAIRNLNLFMAVETETNWILKDPITPQTTLFSYEDLKNKMKSGNTNLQTQYINLALLQQDISLAKTTLYPVLSFHSGTNYSANRFAINDFPTPGQNMTSNGATLNYYANFTLGFKIFDGGRVKRGLQAVKIQEDITQLNIEKLEFQLSTELFNTHNLYLTRSQVFEINKAAFAVARENLEIAKLKETFGHINSFALRDIEMAYLRTGISLFESSYQLLETKTQLVKLTGGIIEQSN